MIRVITPRDLREIARFILTLGLALAIGALIIQLSGREADAAYRALLESAPGSQLALADSLATATPLILTGLATAVAFRAGVFNERNCSSGPDGFKGAHSRRSGRHSDREFLGRSTSRGDHALISMMAMAYLVGLLSRGIRRPFGINLRRE